MYETSDNNRIPEIPAVSASVRKVAVQTYSSPTPGEFPNMAIVANDSYEHGTLTPATLGLIKDMGFNFVQRYIRPKEGYIPDLPAGWEKEERVLKKLLDDAKALGMRVMVRPGGSSNILNPDENMFKGQQDRWREIVKKFYNHEAVAGWMLADEPTAKSDDPTALTIDQLANRFYKIRTTITAEDPWNHPVYVNLGTYRGFREKLPDNKYEPAFPNGFIWVKRYRPYIRAFRDYFGPAVWSASCYPVADLLTDKTENHVRTGALEDLEIFKRLAYSTHRPFWGYVMCSFSANYKKNGDDYVVYTDSGPKVAVRETLTHELIEKMKVRYRIQVHCNLAFGVQGICWWSLVSSDETLVQDKDGKSTVIGYRWAPIDWDGTENEELIDEVKALNEEIRRTSDIFLNATVLETRLTNYHSFFDNFFPKDADGSTIKNTEYPFGPLLNVAKSSTSTDNFGYLISLLYNRDRTYMAFVNLNIETDFPTITLTFSKRMRRLVIKPQNENGTVNKEEIIYPNTPYVLTCSQGEWAIFVVD